MYFRSQRRLSSEVSLSDSIDTDKDGNSLSLMDVISVDDDMLEKLNSRETCERLQKAVNLCLNEREAEIICLRYGLRGTAPWTQREIAVRCSISRSYVSRIEKKALKKLRETMSGERME